MRCHRRPSAVGAAREDDASPRTYPYRGNECASSGADLGRLLALLAAAHESSEDVATGTFAHLYTLLRQQSRRWHE